MLPSKNALTAHPPRHGRSCALAAREKTAEAERAAVASLPAFESAVAAAGAVFAELQQRIALAGEAIRVIETKRENLTRVLAQLALRRGRLDGDLTAEEWQRSRTSRAKFERANIALELPSKIEAFVKKYLEADKPAK